MPTSEFRSLKGSGKPQVVEPERPFAPHGSGRLAALARVAAERAVLERHRTEYRKAHERVGHSEAVKELVERHAPEYGEAYRKARTDLVS